MFGAKEIENREQAEQEIADQGYNGFVISGKWSCISHAIDALDGEWESLLHFCQGKSSDLPQGITEAWHDDSIQYEQFPRDLASIHCESKNEDGSICGAEIFLGNDEDEEEEERVIVPTIAVEYDLKFYGGD